MSRIFLLEGYSPLRDVLKTTLAGLGFEVIKVRSVADARSFILETITAPDWAILDCHVSDGEGADVARMLRDRFRFEIRIVGIYKASKDEWRPGNSCDQIVQAPSTRGELEAILQRPGSP